MTKIYRVQMNSKGMPNFSTAEEVADRPSAVDLSSVYSTAYKNGYEKGKADRPQGENLLEKYPSLFECSVCGASCGDTIPWDCNINYCPNCGARMKGADDE